MLDVAIEVLAAAERPLRARTKLLCHLGTGVTPCTVALLDRPELGPGEHAFAQLRLLHPMPALPGQRFILRGFRALPGRGQTVAGGSVLAVVPGKRRRGARATDGLALLRDGSLEERVAWLLEDAGPAGLAAGALPQRTAASPEAVATVLDRLSERGDALLFDRDRRAYLGGSCFASLVAAAAGEVALHHRRNPLTPSMPKEELRQRLVPGMPGIDVRLFQRILQQLGASGQAVVEGEGVRSPEHAHEVRSADQDLRSQLAGLLRGGGLSPPTPAEIALRLGIAEGRVVAVLKLLAGEGSAVRVKDDLYFETGTIEGLKQRLVGHLKAKGAITTPEFKELTGATRKFTIPLAEFFDQQKLTLRLGEKRVLRGDGRAGVAR
jgi:selenocysteine-specific elongation factor